MPSLLRQTTATRSLAGQNAGMLGTVIRMRCTRGNCAVGPQTCVTRTGLTGANAKPDHVESLRHWAPDRARGATAIDAPVIKAGAAQLMGVPSSTARAWSRILGSNTWRHMAHHTVGPRLRRRCGSTRRNGRPPWMSGPWRGAPVAADLLSRWSMPRCKFAPTLGAVFQVAFLSIHGWRGEHVAPQSTPVIGMRDDDQPAP